MVRKSTSITTGLGSIQSKKIEWLWPLRIPQNKLTLIVGDPGSSKTYVCMDIAARISAGKQWPTGEPGTVGHVIVLGNEDDLEDTVKPRIEVMGGDPANITYIMGMKVPGDDGLKYPDLNQDLTSMGSVIKEKSAKMVLIDPISAYMGYADTHRDAEVRQVLTPLAILAKELNVAIVGIMHLNKSQESSIIYRAQGSIGFMGVARMVHLVAVDKDDKELRLFLPIKSNIKTGKTGLSYRLVDVHHVGIDSEVAKVEWVGEVDVDPEDVVGPPPTDEEREELSQAETWLMELMEEGQGKQAQTNVETLARKAGISSAMLKRAKKAIGINSVKRSMYWEWVLPGHPNG